VLIRRAIANPQRRFGLTVGGAFLALGVFSRVIGSGRLAPYVLPLGAALIGLGLLVPRSLVPVEWLWTRLAAMLHALSSTATLTAVFVLVITPMAVFRRALGYDSLRLRRRGRETYWIRCGATPEPASMKRQF
jgi:hypothetical protein